jgi:hypothetical protein
MAKNDTPPPNHDHLHDPHDDGVPRGGRWATFMAISLALVFAIVIAPDALKIPLAVLSILTLLLGIGMLMMGGKKRKEE